MVQPERVAEDRRRKQTPRGALIVATIGIFLIGAFTLGRLTAPESVGDAGATTTTEPALSQPTTTIDLADFRVTDIQTGRPVRWARAFGIGDTEPVALVQHGGTRFYYFGRVDPTSTSGLQGWVSDDGIFWSELGTVIGPEYTIENVVSTEDALLALGHRSADEAPVILLSDDARSWGPRVLPRPRALEAGERHRVYEAATADGRTVVIGSITFDGDALLTDYLPEEAIESGLGLDWGGQPRRVRVTAPWGFTVRGFTAEDLGIPEEAVSRLDNWRRDQVYVWTSTDSRAWEATEIDAQWIDSLSIADNGTITLTGWNTPGRRSMWTSSDGLVWGATESPSDLNGVISWTYGYAGVSHQQSTGSDVMISDDGTTWEGAGVNALLPDVIDWWLNPVAAGEAGIATFAEGWNGLADRNSPDPELTIEKDGYRLTLSDSILRLDEEATSDNLMIVPAWEDRGADPFIVANLESRQVTFLDPTNIPLVTFGFDELEAAERALFSTQTANEGRLRAFLFSPDGERWSVQDISENLGHDRIAEILVADDRLLAITVDSFDQDSPADVSAWLGILPDYTSG